MPSTVASNLYGDLDLLVLYAVESGGPVHGLNVMDAIETRSGGEINVEDGALYRCLHRLERQGFLSAEWRMSEKRRRAKFYSITSAGKKELERAHGAWERHTRAVGMVLSPSGEVTP